MLTEAFLSAITEAVFGYLLDQTQAGDRLRTWLHGDPQRLAFQVALARAMTTFARHYPQWVAALFDNTLLQGRAAPFLATLLTRDAAPDPAGLAAIWAEDVGVREEQRSHYMAEALPAASALLRWLEAELRARPEFQPLFDSRAQDQTAANTREIAEAVKALGDELQQALKQAAKYQTTIQQAQGLVIGDQASVINVFQTFYTGDYATLQDYYLPPDAVFERVRTDEFVGRAWLESELDAFLQQNPQGAWLLVGEAGVGKTSFLAHLVRERGYYHFFAEQAPGDANVPRALQSLAAQLISRFRLEPYAGRDTLPPTLSTYPDFLARLLRLAAGQLGAGERLVVVLDALDEAGVVAGGNVLGLPRQLPRGVYLVLSQRQQDVPLRMESMPQRVDLRAMDKDNQRDMTDYLQHIATLPVISEQLRAHSYSAAEFVHTLATKSVGNWMYLHYVVEEIRQGHWAPLDLGALPSGLVGYYAGYWERWRRRDRAAWDSLYLPVLATLAAAQEPLTLGTLRRWAGVAEPEAALHRLLREEWSAFVYELSEAERRYRPYHASLRDFFAGTVAADQFPPDIEWLLEEVQEKAQMAQQRIVAALRDQCAGQWPQLIHDPYAQRYLSTHLRRAGNQETLFALMDDRAWYAAQESVDPSGAAYLNDVYQAWALAEEADEPVVRMGRQARLLGREVRCALVTASLRSRSSNVPPALVVALVQKGLRSPAWALALVQQQATSRAKKELVEAIAGDVPPELLPEVLEIISVLADDRERARALAALAPHLPEPLLAQALSLTAALADEGARAVTLAVLAPHLPEPLLAQALSLTAALATEGARARALAALAPHLPEPLLAQALSLTAALADEQARAVTLAVLAPHLPEPLLAQALSLTAALATEGARARTLAVLAPHLPEGQRAAVLAQAFSLTAALADERARARALAALAPHLPEPLLAQALSLTAALATERVRAAALAALAPHLPEPLLAQALSLTVALANEGARARARALAALAPHLPEPLLAQALSLTAALADEWVRVETLAALAPHLPEPLLAQALSLTAALANEGARARALAALAPHLPEGQRAAVLAQALSLTALANEWVRARTLAALAPHLPEGQRAAVLAQALSLTAALANEGERAAAWAALAPHLPEPLLAQALSLTAALADERARAVTLAVLAPHLPEGQRAAVLAQVLSLTAALADERARARALAALAPHLPEPLLAQALSLTAALADEQARAAALAVLAPHLPEGQRAAVLAQALSLTAALADEWARARTLAALAPHLPEPLLAQALSLTAALADEQARAETLAVLAPHLPEPLLAQALSLKAALATEWVRPATMAALALHLPEPLLAQAFSLTAALADEWNEWAQARALAALAPHLPEPLLAQALSLTAALADEWMRVETLAALAPHLPEPLLAQALSLTAALADEGARAEALAVLAPHLPEGQRAAVLAQAFSLTAAIADERVRAVTLAALAAQILRLPIHHRYALWRETLHALAGQRRAELLSELDSLVPVIYELGSEVALRETAQAVIDVGRWWP